MTKLPLLLALAALPFAFGCSDDSTGNGGAGNSSGTGGAAGTGGAGGAGGEETVFSANPPLVLDAVERPAMVAIPSDYDPDVTYPLLVLLHGAGVTGSIQAGFFRFFTTVEEEQFILVYPDGINNVWNATAACCDPTGEVDDVGYISGLIEEALQTYNTDPARVYLMGHSNGGFMSFRMACERPDLITGIVTLAASTFDDPNDCQPADPPVSVLSVHGTEDPTIPYDGSDLGEFSFPGAIETSQRFAARAGCDINDTTDLGNIDLSEDWDGAETVRLRYNGCDEGLAVELWTLEQGIGCSSFTCNPHIPVFMELWGQLTTEWLFGLSR